MIAYWRVNRWVRYAEAFIREAVRYIGWMIAFTGCLACCMLAMLFFPQTEFGRLCHHQLVERPVAALSRFRSHHIVYAVILVPVLTSGGEFIALLGPEFFAAYAMELAIYIDAVAMSLLASAYASIRGVVNRFAGILHRPLRRARSRQPRSSHGTRPDRRAANDDDWPAAAMAA